MVVGWYAADEEGVGNAGGEKRAFEDVFREEVDGR